MKRTIILGLLLAGATTPLLAENPFKADYSRKGKWEVYAAGQYMNISEEEGFVKAGVNVYGGGVGVGYHVIDQVCINADLNYLSWDGFISTPNLPFIGGASDTGNASSANGRIGVDYNILKKRLTPFVSVGGGYLVAIDEGYHQYMLDAGAGLRWDFNDHWFVKAAYRATWNIPNDSGDSDTILGHGAVVAIGYKF
jgi:opacity protein-like surface antigen